MVPRCGTLSWYTQNSHGPQHSTDHPLIILSAVQMGKELALWSGERQQVGGRRGDLTLLIILSSLSLIKIPGGKCSHQFFGW